MRAARRAASASRSNAIQDVAFRRVLVADIRQALRQPARVTVIRLQTRGQFQAVLAGRVLSRTDHFVLHSTDPGAPLWLSGTAGLRSTRAGPSDCAVWLGAMVPKRWARRAVTRNTIKRQIYAVGSANASSLPQGAHLVRLRCAFDRTKFVSATSDALSRAVRHELHQLFERMQRPPVAVP